MVRSTRILHKNEEFLIQDNGPSTASRSITFLVRPEDEQACGEVHSKLILTNHGLWAPVAVWERDALRFFQKGWARKKSVLLEILEDYLDRHNRTADRQKHKRYYYIEVDGAPEYSLTPSHPYGLAVKVYSTKRQAQEWLDGEAEGPPASRIRQTDSLRSFLIQAADDGYAGAILDNREPMYFCLDGSENMVFIRLSMNEEDEVEEFLLEETGKWSKFEGREDLELFLDQDNCDRNMVRILGEIPFFGHGEMDHAWTLELRGSPGESYVLAAEEGPYAGIPGGSSILLFHSKKSALDFILERGLFQCEAVRVDKLKSFLKAAHKKHLNVLLEPFNHRANGGALWLNGDEIILDSFSGFWVVDEDWTFERVIPI